MRGEVIASAFFVAGSLLTHPVSAQTTESGANLGAPLTGEREGAEPSDATHPSDSDTTPTDEGDAASRSDSPRLVVLASDEPSTTGLLGMLRAQLPGWQVLRQEEPAGMLAVERLRGELRPRDALLWLEADGSVVHVVIQGNEGRALASPIPADTAGSDRSRVYALAAVGLLTELSERRLRMAAYGDSVVRIRERQLDELREHREEDARRIERLTRSQEALRAELASLQARRTSRWRSPIAASGWFVRLGWVNGLAPDQEYDGWASGSNPSFEKRQVGGVRASVGHRFAERFAIGGALVTLHAQGLWNGSLSAFASVHSRTRFRVGLSGEIGLLVVRESGGFRDLDVNWASARFYLPLELGVVTHDRGGVFLKVGPLVAHAPSGWFVGYDMSLEWEFD